MGTMLTLWPFLKNQKLKKKKKTYIKKKKLS